VTDWCEERPSLDSCGDRGPRGCRVHGNNCCAEKPESNEGGPPLNPAGLLSSRQPRRLLGLWRATTSTVASPASESGSRLDHQHRTDFPYFCALIRVERRATQISPAANHRHQRSFCVSASEATYDLVSARSQGFVSSGPAGLSHGSARFGRAVGAAPWGSEASNPGGGPSIGPFQALFAPYGRREKASRASRISYRGRGSAAEGLAPG